MPPAWRFHCSTGKDSRQQLRPIAHGRRQEGCEITCAALHDSNEPENKAFQSALIKRNAVGVELARAMESIDAPGGAKTGTHHH